MIYTTYFANLKKLPKNVHPISICGKAPDWYDGLQYKKLAPKYDFFMKWKETGDNDYYIKCFEEQVLSKLNPHEVVEELVGMLDINEDIDIALVCYEAPDKFCHRHLVADWFNKAGYNCEEYGYRKVVVIKGS